jgi:DNA-directed RNA polymerase sigma subunit (sigma70/sigma32)
MKLFIDTADPDQIRLAVSWGIIDGVTTNPTHVSKTGRPAPDLYKEILSIIDGPISLETPIGEEEDSHLGDFIEDRAVISPAEAVININLKEQTESVLKTLTPREEQVIKMRFGFVLVKFKEAGMFHQLPSLSQSRPPSEMHDRIQSVLRIS